MKLFKKLAAVMLVAALALTMVGCGSGDNTLNQIKDYISDVAAIYDDEIVNKKELDDLASKLVAEANKAATKTENKDKDVLDLLVDGEVVKAAGIDSTKEAYAVTAVENYTLVSSVLNQEKTAMLTQVLMDDDDSVEIGSANIGDDYEYGLAMGKIGDKEYIVMLKK